MNLRPLHRYSAVLIAAFTVLHLANHLASLAGIPAHITFMDYARKIYRLPAVEALLLAAVAFQVLSGLWLAVGGWRRRRGFAAWLQAAAGLYLAFFLLVHVGSVLFGRAALGLDTNFHFAAAGLHVPPNHFFFAPYYFLAVVALFVHLGCAAYRHFPAKPQRVRAAYLAAPIVFGVIVSALIVLSLAGKIQPVDVPAEYKATYDHAAR